MMKLAWLFCLLPALAAAAPTTAPTEKVWQLTNYLHGTAPEIQHTLNAEVIRLRQKVAEVQAELKGYRRDLETDEAESLVQMRRSNEYKLLVSKLRAAEDEAVRSVGVQGKEFPARQKYAAAKLTVAKAQQKWLAADESLILDHKRIVEDEKAIERTKASLEKALAWRDELIDATRVAMLMRGPVHSDSVGVIGKVKVLNVAGSGVLVEYMAPEELDQGEANTEGIVKVSVLNHRTKLLLSGIEVNVLREGQEAYINRDFHVLKSASIGYDLVYVAHTTSSDRDRLIQLITAPIPE